MIEFGVELHQWKAGEFGVELDQWKAGEFGVELDQWKAGEYADAKIHFLWCGRQSQPLGDLHSFLYPQE